MTETALQLDHVAVAFPPPQRRKAHHHALEDVDLVAPTGQVTALIGANGAGKTTALRALTGAIPITTGRITVRGERMDLPESRLPRGVGIVPDSPLHKGSWSAEDIAHVHRRTDPDLDVRDFGRRLRAHGIDPAADLDALSRGQQTLLLVDLALASKADLLVLDEPFAHLDPLARRDLIEDLQDHLARHEDGAVLLSTHDLEGMERFVDHLVVLVHGRTVLAGEPGALAEEHLVATLTSDVPEGPAASPLIGAVAHGDGREALVRAEDAVDLPRGTDLRPASVQDVVTFTLREAS